MKKVTEHGSRYAYQQGCRCRECMNANNAYLWARRKVDEWSEPLTEMLSRSGNGRSAAVFVGDSITITDTDLFEALREAENDLKIQTLVRYWYKHIAGKSVRKAN